MRYLIGALVLALGATGATAQQQRQVPITQGVMWVSPDAPCPDGMARRVYGGQQQVAQQDYQQPAYFCVAGDEPITSDASQVVPLASETAWPTLVALSDFGPVGANSDVQLSRLSAAELAELQQAVTQIRFADYRLSGCHDRAHAAYLPLPATLRSKAVKLWVVAPSATTRGLRGVITYPADPSASWRYHVAIAFATASGVAVFDPTLSPGRLISENEWLGSFRYPPLSMRFFAPAEIYQFFDEDDDVVGLNNQKPWVANKDIWVGNGYEYEGAALQNNWIPNNLARDAVGSLVESGRACAALMQHRGKPDDLAAALLGTLPASCTSEQDLYRRTRDLWIGLLASA